MRCTYKHGSVARETRIEQRSGLYEGDNGVHGPSCMQGGNHYSLQSILSAIRLAHGPSTSANCLCVCRFNTASTKPLRSNYFCKSMKIEEDIATTLLQPSKCFVKELNGMALWGASYHLPFYKEICNPRPEFPAPTGYYMSPGNPLRIRIQLESNTASILSNQFMVGIYVSIEESNTKERTESWKQKQILATKRLRPIDQKRDIERVQ